MLHSSFSVLFVFPNGSIVGNKLFIDWLYWALISTSGSPVGWFPIRLCGGLKLLDVLWLLLLLFQSNKKFCACLAWLRMFSQRANVIQMSLYFGMIRTKSFWTWICAHAAWWVFSFCLNLNKAAHEASESQYRLNYIKCIKFIDLLDLLILAQ